MNIGASAHLGINRNPAAVVIYNTVYGSHTQSAALELGGEEGFKNPGLGFFVHPLSIILNPEVGILSQLLSLLCGH